MKITIICVGKIKEKYLNDAINEYTKRLKKYLKIEIIEVSDEKVPETFSISEENIAKNEEGKRIAKHMKDSFTIALAINGIQMSSEDFAGFIQKSMNNRISHISFIIGGSIGLDEKITNNADYLMSFSKMTFPHQLMRVILLEQIYRAEKILANEPYHK